MARADARAANVETKPMPEPSSEQTIASEPDASGSATRARCTSRGVTPSTGHARERRRDARAVAHAAQQRDQPASSSSRCIAALLLSRARPAHGARSHRARRPGVARRRRLPGAALLRRLRGAVRAGLRHARPAARPRACRWPSWRSTRSSPSAAWRASRSGAWVLRSKGISVERIARRSVLIFVLTSAVNVGAVVRDRRADVARPAARLARPAADAAAGRGGAGDDRRHARAGRAGRAARPRGGRAASGRADGRAAGASATASPTRCG